MKMLISSLILLASVSSFAADKAKPSSAKVAADTQAVNTACAPDAKAAGCPDAKIGKGLLKCIREYKKFHKDFMVSEACKNAGKTLGANSKK